MQAIDYKVKGENRRAIDAASLLAQMDEAERFNGSTEAKIYDAWYDLKKSVAEVLLAEPDEEKEQPKEEK